MMSTAGATTGVASGPLLLAVRTIQDSDGNLQELVTGIAVAAWKGSESKREGLIRVTLYVAAPAALTTPTHTPPARLPRLFKAREQQQGGGKLQCR